MSYETATAADTVLFSFIKPQRQTRDAVERGALAHLRGDSECGYIRDLTVIAGWGCDHDARPRAVWRSLGLTSSVVLHFFFTP